MSSRAAALGEFVGLVQELGGDPYPLLEEVGLTERDLSSPETKIPAAAVVTLFIRGAEETGEAHFGAMLAARRNMRTYLGAVGRLVWSAPTLRKAIYEFSKYVSVHISGSRYDLDVDGELARLRNTYVGMRTNPQIVEHNLAIVCILLRALTNNQWAPYFVYCSTSRPKDTEYLRRLFGCPIVFDADFNGIEFHSSDLSIPLPTSDEELGNLFHSLVDPILSHERKDLTEIVTELIEKNLDSGHYSIESVARFLPFSRSTLQKKLMECGTNYQALLNQVRDRKAREMLISSDVSIGQLSDMLGYKNIDAFSRAFKKRIGESPSIWRRSTRLVRNSASTHF